MLKLTEDQRNDDLVKSLLESGFDEGVIAEWIENGSITLEKSIDDDKDPDEAGEKKDPTEGAEKDPDENKDPDGNKEPENDPDGDGDDKNKDDNDDKKDDDDKKDPDPDDKKDPEPTEGDPDKDNLEKGCVKAKLDEEDKEELVKSIADAVTAQVLKNLEGILENRNEGFSKSIENIMGGMFNPENDLAEIKKSIDGFRTAIEAFGNVAPQFKSAGLNRSVIEKSIGGGRDENDKTVLSVSRDRTVVRALIEKCIDEEKDTDIQKSLRENTAAYIMDPICGAIGEQAARYMYEQKNVRLVK